MRIKIKYKSIILFFALLCLSLQANRVSISYKLQLAFIEKFTLYIKWPVQINKDFVIAIYGDSPFKDIENTFYKDVFIQQKTVKVIKNNNLYALQAANILYICDDKMLEISNIKKWASINNVLTIANASNAAKKGVMINFYEENDKVRFEINYEEFQENNFKISSKLLKLARIVE